MTDSQFLERMSDSSRKIAVELHHDYIGTEHLFLAAIDGGVGQKVIQNFDLNAKDIREVIVEVVMPSDRVMDSQGASVYTANFKKSLRNASGYASSLSQELGTGHVIRAIFEDRYGIPAEIMHSLYGIRNEEIVNEAESLVVNGRSSRPSRILDSAGKPLEKS